MRPTPLQSGVGERLEKVEEEATLRNVIYLHFEGRYLLQ